MPRWADRAERFWARVDSSAGDDGCWPWLGVIDRYGYGKVWFDGQQRGAYRLAVILTSGPIPDGMTVDHLCRNRACVNPSHLEVVTHAENIRRAFPNAGRPLYGPPAPRVQTHCKRGHEFTAENTRRFASGSRECVACRRIRQVSYRQRQRQAS